MIFRHFRLDVNESNAFLLACERTRDAILIDAGDFPSEMSAFIAEQGLTLGAVFVTHDHFDHTGGVDGAVAEYGAEVLSGTGRAGGKRGRKVKTGDTVQVGTLEGAVFETPGHTPDSVSLVFPGMAFTGDALFAGSVGGTGSAGQARRQINAIREHILSLPGDYEIHTGHGPSTTVAIEKNHNPFLVS